MAALYLPTAKPFLPSSMLHTQNPALRPQRQTLCKAGNETTSSSVVAGRRRIALCLTATTLVSGSHGMWLGETSAAILEADDDEELLEKVKKDRKKRLEKQGAISAEKEYLQELVYKLSKVGQAIEKNDLSSASSVLGSSNDKGWIQKVSSAMAKLSSSDEEKAAVDIFNSSLGSLISSVSKNDIEASKVAFVVSATAFEKWTSLSGLVDQLKGL